jgi:hypothetical protein
MAEDGSLKSSLILLLDGGHGPGEVLMQFATGVMWVVADFNVVHAVANAGGCSKWQVQTRTCAYSMPVALEAMLRVCVCVRVCVCMCVCVIASRVPLVAS